jgi:hypothetical protein
MAGGGEPVPDDGLELPRRRAGVGRHDQFHKPLHTGVPQSFQVALQGRLVGLCPLPLRVLWRKGLHPIQDEGELHVHGLLGPEGAVVVEHGDAFGGRHVIRPALLRHLGDETENGLFGGAGVPGRQGIGGGQCGGAGREGQDQAEH